MQTGRVFQYQGCNAIVQRLVVVILDQADYPYLNPAIRKEKRFSHGIVPSEFPRGCLIDQCGNFPFVLVDLAKVRHTNQAPARCNGQSKQIEITVVNAVPVQLECRIAMPFGAQNASIHSDSPRRRVKCRCLQHTWLCAKLIDDGSRLWPQSAVSQKERHHDDVFLLKSQFFATHECKLTMRHQRRDDQDHSHTKLQHNHHLIQAYAPRLQRPF